MASQFILLSTRQISIRCLLLLALTGLSFGIGIPLPGLGSFNNNQASGISAQSAGSGNGAGLLANVLGDTAAGLGELSNMGLDLSGMLRNNGGLGGLVSTLASNNEFVDMVRQMPMSDSLGKVLNLLKNSIPDITTNGGSTVSTNLGSESRQSLFNRDDVTKLLDQLSRPRRRDSSTEILNPQDEVQPPQRLSESPNELVNNQLQQQQPQQPLSYGPTNPMINNMPQQQPALNSQNPLMNRLNQYGELQAPANMPLDNTLQNQPHQRQPTQQVNLLLQNPSLIPHLDRLQPTSASTASMPNLASLVTPETLNRLASSGAIQSLNIPPEIINRLSSSGMLQNITPELINRLVSSGALQNTHLVSDLINRLSSTGLLQSNTNPASQITQYPLGQLGSTNIQI